ncbi:Phage small terminase subunit [compost metagenome]
MLWRFDAGDFAGGLDAAEYVLRHGLKMPDRFNRSTGCVVAEEVAEAALKAIKADGGTFDPLILERAHQLTEEHDMPDQARAKLFLAMGKVALKSVNPEQIDAPAVERLNSAKALLTRAIELHDACGGKTDLGNAERFLKKHAGSAS